MTTYVWDRYYDEVREAIRLYDTLVQRHGEEAGALRFWASSHHVFKKLRPHDIETLIAVSGDRAMTSTSSACMGDDFIVGSDGSDAADHPQRPSLWRRVLGAIWS